MRKPRQKLKERLRTTTNTAASRTVSDTAFNAEQPPISAQLARLRKESRGNTLSRSIETSVASPACNFFLREQVEAELQERREEQQLRQRVSGPVPPRSWQAVWKHSNGKKWCVEDENIKLRKQRRRAWDGAESDALPSLTMCCARVVVRNLHRYRSLVVPTRLKQLILSVASVYNPIDDKLLTLFEKETEYEELDLANSSVSFDALQKSFWRTIATKPREEGLSAVAEDWEQIADDDDNVDEKLLAIPYAGCANSITEISANGGRLFDAGDLEDTTKRCTSRLARLRRLNLAFVPDLPAIPLATLLASTMPLLTCLSVAGCFNDETGPHAVGILSRNLINLTFWDVSFCKWMTDRVLLTYVNWQRDLRCLQELALVCTAISDGLPERLLHGRAWVDIVVN